MTKPRIELTPIEAAIREISGAVGRSVPAFLDQYERGRDRELRRYFTAAVLPGVAQVNREDNVAEIACRLGAEVAYRFQTMEDEIEAIARSGAPAPPPRPRKRPAAKKAKRRRR